MGKIRHYRWIVVGLLFLATAINYIDRQVIGLLKPLLEKEFNWTETQFARIVMAFTLAYAIGLLVSGRIIDRIGTKLGFAITITVWSIAGMLHALARSVWSFSLVRILLGLGEAGNFPAGVKTVAEWFPKNERGLATGIFNSGTSVGVVLSVLIVPLILSFGSWQQVFWITGSLGFLWLAAWWILYEVPSKQKRLTAEEYQLILQGQESGEQAQQKVRWQRLFSFPQTWAMITGKGLIDPIFWFFLFWLPSYFSATFSLDLSRPSMELLIIYASTTVGSIGGGYLSSLLIKKGWPVLKARKAVLLIFAIVELSILFTQFASQTWIVVTLISLAVAVHQAWATNVFTLATDLFPKEAVSSVAGIAGMAGAVGGIFFPLLVGYVLDRFKAIDNLTGGYHLIFSICAFTYLVAWLIIHLLTRKSGRVKLAELIPKG